MLKLETLQHTGSFKARGAFANLLLRDVPEARLWWPPPAATTAWRPSARPASRGVLYPGSMSPESRPRPRSPAIRGYGAQLVIAGDTYADALAAPRRLRSGAMAVHADQAETILGVGTLATEPAGQVPAAAHRAGQ